MLNKIATTKSATAICLLLSLFLLTGFTDAQIDPKSIVDIFSDTAQSQIAQAGFFFTLAAWLHSGRVKNEIKSNFSALTLAINEVAEAFKADLKRHGDRLDKLDERMESLEKQKLAKEI